MQSDSQQRKSRLIQQQRVAKATLNLVLTPTERLASDARLTTSLYAPNHRYHSHHPLGSRIRFSHRRGTNTHHPCCGAYHVRASFCHGPASIEHVILRWPECKLGNKLNCHLLWGGEGVLAFRVWQKEADGRARSMSRPPNRCKLAYLFAISPSFANKVSARSVSFASVAFSSSNVSVRISAITSCPR
jgi:hypothetical protein